MRTAVLVVLALLVVPAVASAAVMYEEPRVKVIGGTLYPHAGVALVETTHGGVGVKYTTTSNTILADGAHATLTVVVCTWHGFSTIPDECPRYDLAL